MAPVDPYGLRRQLIYGLTDNKELVILKLNDSGEIRVDASVAFAVPTASLTTTTAAVTTTASQIRPAKANRKYLTIMNVGTTDVTIGFGTAPVAGAGIVLASAGIGLQGGSLSFESVMTTQSIWAITAVDSTNLVIVEG